MGDKNGYNSSNFKRNSGQDGQEEHHEQDGDEGVKINEKAGEYIRELLSEKIKLNNVKFPISARLIDSEVSKVQKTGRIPVKDLKYVDVYNEKHIKVVVKVLVPSKIHPKVNFIGKLMGPKGTTMKQLQDETMCKMAVLGRGSMRDREKEEELRNSLDPKHAHLSDELHVEISALAPPAEAHARIAYALAEVKKYLIPDANDMMRQQPMHEFMDRGSACPPDQGPARRPLLETPQDKHVVYRACTITNRSFSYQNPIFSTEGPSHHAPLRPQHAPPRPQHAPPRPQHAPPRPQHTHPRAPRPPPIPRIPPHPMRPMHLKTKVLSILDRARSAMETSYSYEDPYEAPEPHVRQGPRGPPRAPETDYEYDRGEDRFYEDEDYYKEEAREYKASARDVGTRRPVPGPSHTRHYARASPYARASK